MRLEKVNSSNIDSIGYDSTSHTLTVKFHNGGTYHYDHVSPEKFEAFKNADSMGSHLHKHIKPHHSVKKA